MKSPDSSQDELVHVDFRMRSRRTAPPPAEVRRSWSGRWLVVETAGEMDLQVVPLLSHLCDDPCFIVVDLLRVTFMDCSSLGVLAEVQRHAVAAGGSVRLAAPSEPALRILTLTGLERSFPVFDTVAEAIASPTAGSDGGRRRHLRPARRPVRPHHPE